MQMIVMYKIIRSCPCLLGGVIGPFFGAFGSLLAALFTAGLSIGFVALAPSPLLKRSEGGKQHFNV